MDHARSRMKFLVLVIVVALLALVLILEKQRRDAVNQLEAVQVDTASADREQNKELAKRVVQQVSRLYALPKDIEPTVATIVNVEVLRARNAFYNVAENGDFLLVTPTRAILYDQDRNIILDVAPVQIQAAPAAAAASSAASLKK